LRQKLGGQESVFYNPAQWECLTAPDVKRRIAEDNVLVQSTAVQGPSQILTSWSIACRWRGRLVQGGIVGNRIATVALVVRDYDEAIAFYCGALGFPLVSDTDLGGGKRWVTVAAADGGSHVLLAKADGPAQEARIGDQTGGRVGFFLHTDDFARDHAAFVAAGVLFLEEPRHEAYGTVAVFEDLYGNKWDLIEPRD
jgi:catechol 2,3-dioxygenase-like lactoylglutathione lyase family enzyme